MTEHSLVLDKVLMIVHGLTTLAGLVWLIVRNIRTDRRFHAHMMRCHPAEAEEIDGKARHAQE